MPSVNGEVASAAPRVSKMVHKHPLDQLSNDEVDIAREVILKARQSLILFRNVFTIEPPKAQMIKFLTAEHAGTLSADTPRPPRQARVQYDVISQDKSHQYMESVVDLTSATEVSKRTVEKHSQQALTVDEFREFNEVVVHSELFKKAVAEFELPEGFEVAIDPWPYGGPDEGEDFTRLVQSADNIFCECSFNADTLRAYVLPLTPERVTLTRITTAIPFRSSP
jgi:primary-amine oxidase